MVRVDGPCQCWAEDPGEGHVGGSSSTLLHLYVSDVPLLAEHSWSQLSGRSPMHH